MALSVMTSLRPVAAVVVTAAASLGCVLTVVATLSVPEMLAPAAATAHLGIVPALPSSIVVT
jgi:hypothetical protein